MGLQETILKIVEDIDSQFLGGPDERLKGIPSRNPIAGACLQTHIALADPLPSSQFSGVVVQKDFGMDEHHEQLVSLFEGACFALIQLVIATLLGEELIKLRPQSGSLGSVWLCSIGNQLAVELPERLAPRL